MSDKDDIVPLPEGQVPIKDQAAARGEPVPAGKTVRELEQLGYTMHKSWPMDAILYKDENSPTGYVISPFTYFSAMRTTTRSVS